MIAARGLLCDAAALLDAEPRLHRAARPVRSFHDGARWMRLAMRTARGRRVPRIGRSLEAVGWRKYATCVAGTIALAIVFVTIGAAWLLPLCVPFFYSLEVRRLFDVPLAIDGRSSRENARLLAISGGTLRAMGTVMTLATVMLLGGCAGRGFVRSWCLGCAAVVIWYERVRGAPGATDEYAPSVPASRATTRARMSVLTRGTHASRFEFGANAPLLLRRERVTMPIVRPIRLLFASDLHLGNRWSPRVVDEVVRHLRAARPDAFVLGGDLADSHAGLRSLRRLLHAARGCTPTIAAVLGNHDRWSGGVPIAETLDAFGVARLDRCPIDVRGVTLVGTRSQLDEASDLHLDRRSTCKCGAPAIVDRQRTILVAHDPARYERDVRLTLAGHLHGGQCVLWNRGPQQWPAWLINRHTLLRRDDATSTLIVSRGAADSLPLRFNCPREVVLVDLAPP